MRALLNAGEREKSFRAPVSAWAKKNQVGIQVTYGEKDQETLFAKAARYEVDIIIVSCTQTFFKLIGGGKGTQQDWAGSVLWRQIPILIINPLAHTTTVPEGHFLLNAHLDKIPKICKNKKPEEFNWSVLNSHAKCIEAIKVIKKAAFIVEDIETSRLNGITSIGYTLINHDLTIGHTYVLNLAVPALAGLWVHARDINNLDIPKIFHNGEFDSFHLCRWWMPPRNYYLDTEYMWHSWYAELKKALAFVSNTVVWDAWFWKHEAAKEPLLYNAKDCINTARIFLHMLEHMPDWAWKNYSKLVPNIAPVVYCAFEGFKVDEDRLKEARVASKQKKEQYLAELRMMAATPEFNPNSPAQVSTWLYKILRAKKPPARGAAKHKKNNTGTDTKTLARVAMQHPLYAKIIKTLKAYRAEAKAYSTYYTARLTPGGRLLWTLNVDGTETERFSCNASSLYAPLLDGQTLSSQQNYGTQLQNIPPYMKVTLRADDGFELLNVDKSKSEAYCTAKLSGDKVFEKDLYGDTDFYLALGNRLFGLDIQDKGDPLRQVFKKINHQCSYMGGPEALVDAIGPAEVFKYMGFLNYKSTPAKFAKFCIDSLLKKYKRRQEWWDETRTFAKNFGYIETPDGHHRHVFDYGKRNITHAILRGLVAHQPQHLSVAGLNEAFWKTWYFIQLQSDGEFRLKGQVHDSIVAQAIKFRIDFYSRRQLEVMDIPQETSHGTLRIPLDLDTSFYWKETGD